MNATTLTSRAAAATVAGVAGYASYRHIQHVATLAGEHRSVASLLPFAIDGLIVVGTMAMIEDKRSGRVPRLSARVALVFGILATLAANIASAAPTGLSRAVAAVPAVSFLLAVEVLSRSGRRQADKTVEWQYQVDEKGSVVERTLADCVDAIAVPVDKTPDKIPVASRNAGRPSAAVRVAEAIAHAPYASNEEIADRLRLSPRTVRRHRASVDKTPERVNGATCQLVEVVELGP